MSEIGQELELETAVEETKPSESLENGDGHKKKVHAAGVAAAVLGGAAVAVGVARAREQRSWNRLEEQMQDGGVHLKTAGDLTRPFPLLTVPEMLHRTVERYGGRTAMLHRVDKDWVPVTYSQLAERVANLALGLAELGVQKGDRVALLSENRPEWALVDLAALSLGAVNVPLYASLPPPQVQHIASDSQAVVIVVEDQKQLDKVLAVRNELPALRHVVLIEADSIVPEGVTSLTAVERLGSECEDRVEYERRWHSVQPDDLASIIYTSGTTGLPKGAMLTHDNFMSNAQAVPLIVEITSADTFLSFLPLAHVFERLAGHYLPLICGSSIAYSQGLRHLMREISEVEPTVLCCVPRLYESIQGRVVEEVGKRKPAEQKAFAWAMSVGSRRNGPRAVGQKPGFLAEIEYGLADKIVLSKIRARAGKRLRFFISGGAPLSVETDKFFNAVGWTILQGYGLTETAPVICVNRPGAAKFGTVGPPIPGVEVRIAEDGEILSRGPHIMQGYYNQPEATSQAIDADGWFHTGDIGQLDGDGYLRITDRKKDLLVLANGKNVAPQPIEAKLKSSPFIAWSALFGDKQPVVVALVVPEFERVQRWAEEKGIPTASRRALLDHAEVRKLFKQEIDSVSKELADFEKVRRFALLENEFSLESGELTPTLKVKRRVVAEKYADEIARLYGGAED